MFCFYSLEYNWSYCLILRKVNFQRIICTIKSFMFLRYFDSLHSSTFSRCNTLSCHVYCTLFSFKSPSCFNHFLKNLATFNLKWKILCSIQEKWVFFSWNFLLKSEVHIIHGRIKYIRMYWWGGGISIGYLGMDGESSE